MLGTHLTTSAEQLDKADFLEPKTEAEANDSHISSCRLPSEMGEDTMIQEMIDESKKQHNMPETPVVVKEVVECPESPVKQPRKFVDNVKSEPVKKVTEYGDFMLRGYHPKNQPPE